ncbi:aryl-alcohol dehydrogenase-like predicted oxidoreductase [Rhizobium sp. PP-F2F-G38]|uniref:Aldo/keto reductase n=1 Tax=Ferranicluibacter rubi TaxID=2715133 RepID=A0AA44CBX4_9HYPH|nr:aldo/keto reductase [Ferranicluibacter rubi]PYE34122.1 aryl-alcohol dehydrogenase-like predicted oxidoreductase [Rhizobium sp. PP-WC-1G-195]PYE96758.1 aryl-alcohol dehydrogenase-like predicted oxidoreductase [Rhizobium sp. PP-F2F-G38]TCP86170.1 aryl-alcohol dehydrogenase-like predicted oxidoreductase [Rhizobium sp. PP-CC-2G-626]TCQ23557.1 aryl-alcohol dehydrogenase-like predicted oxidoreductase [Rhizobium sp. PP-CC-3G-465]NHT77284.1 aldo/keto reductase [Ferranicluibacter rubi]
MQRIAIAPDYEISRVIRGGWQLAGGHGTVDGDTAVEDMIAFADAGITTFDCADIYTGVEELIGRFRLAYGNLRGAEALSRIRVHTKFVPDLAVLPTIDKAYVEGVIDTSRKRLKIETLDLVQFHWWALDVPGWLETAGWLKELSEEGKIGKVSLTNFDADHVAAIVDAGVPVASLQLQYSLLDRRPEKRMVDLARAKGFALLCYGTVAGGFLSDRWLGEVEPEHPLENRSLTKYKLIIDDFGGWDLFQSLLLTLRRIADRHETDIATVASAAMLTKPTVAAVIVGARNRSHLPANLAISDIVLDDADHAALAAVLADARPLDGDVYALERDRTGRHGAIMKYNLNKGE